MRRLILFLPLLMLTISCAEFSGERSSNSILSSNNDPVFLFSEGQEVALGQQTAQAALKQYKKLPDAELQAYVDGLGQRLARLSERPSPAYSFTVLEDKQVNAFAAPGGFIFVTTGILKSLKDESELAAVLGHEIGHVVKRHSLKRMQRQFVAQNGLGVLTALLGGKLGALTAQFGPIASNLVLLRNGREAELESDEQGLQISAGAGLDPAGMVGVQSMLLAQSGGSKGPFAEIFASHPPSEDRIAQARALLPRYQGAQEKGAQSYKIKVLDRLK